MSAKYVRLREGVTMRGDIRTGWAISGNDVQEMPENEDQKQYVESQLRAGLLEEASKAEFDEVQAHKTGTVASTTHQESTLRETSAAAAKRQADARQSRAKSGKGGSGTSEGDQGGTQGG